MKVDVIVIGAGASGLMCAIEAAKRGRKVLVLDHANKVGKKILMSGGGRCNFTNYYVEPARFLSQNPHFCKSALTRYTQWDFIALVDTYQLNYHEKTLGQLFCDGKSHEIVDILLNECRKYKVEIKLNTTVNQLRQCDQVAPAELGFYVKTTAGDYHAESVVIATGGLSIPTMGASGFGYEIARQFGLQVLPTSAALVPFVLGEHDKLKYAELSGVSVFTEVSCNNQSFRENLLFTHRGLSGPVMLQISSYWQLGDYLHINLLPEINSLSELLHVHKKSQGVLLLKSLLENYLPKRLLPLFVDELLLNKKLADLSNSEIEQMMQCLQSWQIKPCGTEGYRTAEVTKGGVSCDEISSKTMETHKIKGLYFIGEVVDVAGWLGGYNFQWAWASGWAAGQFA
ncbi:NAD(P)/FAD-dependent oxidoreductase [Cysteiniphilum sp. QT6929]|uniref:NAD(P)/FAD-dependent oxidoreductase n=1 Tax=Cysteiniphilum sp. QT6929 TaxID=2975055 RepID=UPI0024B33A87|nr:NAD(P)/FAD-dependent oxidoreductase [Cysteiniphilum sp. QT6929]WHN65495.1 NAD(P)/FAD-dependent oxidoreductase [Cysteiniphilum sp. QT6929]